MLSAVGFFQSGGLMGALYVCASILVFALLAVVVLGMTVSQCRPSMFVTVRKVSSSCCNIGPSRVRRQPVASRGTGGVSGQVRRVVGATITGSCAASFLVWLGLMILVGTTAIVAAPPVPDEIKRGEMWQLIEAARAHAGELRDSANAAEAERWERLATAAQVELERRRLTSR